MRMAMDAKGARVLRSLRTGAIACVRAHSPQTAHGVLRTADGHRLACIARRRSAVSGIVRVCQQHRLRQGARDAPQMV